MEMKKGIKKIKKAGMKVLKVIMTYLLILALQSIIQIDLLQAAISIQEKGIF